MADTTTLISVRGEARLVVPPDFASLSGGLTTTQDTKAEALRVASAALERLTGDLEALGGRPQTPDTLRRRLVWAAYSSGTRQEYVHDEQTGRYGPTSRMKASVSVSLSVRAFELLDTLGEILAAHELFDLHHVEWGVDHDNPTWAEVRAAAIRNAITQGRQYAQALGGSLDHLEHLADAGLLDGGEADPTRHSRQAPLSAVDGADAPSLDPVPQELIAIIDARFVATVGAL
jgi:uncharacterized protein YggE